jgi:hypothetical protein
MKENHKPRGGARSGAGRKAVDNPAKLRTIRLTDADWLKLKMLGGAQWIREQLAKIPM